MLDAPLLDYIEQYPFRAGAKATGTSEDAATIIEKHGRAATLRQKALEVIEDSVFGLTADEAASKLCVTVLACRPRLSELRQRGLIRDTGIRRKNISGINAVVWIAA